MPTHDFLALLRAITRIKASKETNLTNTIKHALTLFPDRDVTKHLTLITDALPTVGKSPEQEVLEAVSLARNHNITISLIGIRLDNKGEELAKKIVEIGQGNLFICSQLKDVSQIVVEDYYSVA